MARPTRPALADRGAHGDGRYGEVAVSDGAGMKPSTEKAREYDRENREQARRVLAGEVVAPWLEE